MQFTRSLPLVTSFLVLVTAQYETPEDIPICAYSPIQNIINAAGCQVTETSCFCAKPNIIPDFAEACYVCCHDKFGSRSNSHPRGIHRSIQQFQHPPNNHLKNV
ncbi:uncharacterized protein RCC_02215 [Ramularia collo-cygni]|uniref:Extracellular membrane protein CFEM domain-containing protein n=1 Tax=Ramularia collo-cygni TaxID=112498 RepID=A0A2D3UMD4_9PEZI|nr:uncharacterized protein RCC_02215 [Ramularia collo-cygni]CZT16372.1 uncharacterized protein RCC_02215 [Ramularia collo-cygni]